MMLMCREHDKLLVQSVAVQKKTTEWKPKNGMHHFFLRKEEEGGKKKKKKKKKKACCLR